MFEVRLTICRMVVACLTQGWGVVNLKEVLVGDERLYGMQGDAEVSAEFFKGDDLVFFFVEWFSDIMHEITAVAFTSSGDALDVFGVDAEARDSGFHNYCSLVVQRFEI